MKSIEVVAAALIQDNTVFCAQRSNHGETGGKWEFPGGKIETGETREEALHREVFEELDVTISITQFLITTHHQYKTFFLAMHVFLAKITNGSPTLKVHQKSTWLSSETLDSVDWAKADIPILKALKPILNENKAP